MTFTAKIRLKLNIYG